MSRPWQTWVAYGVCLIVVLTAMGWITRIAVRLERSEQATRCDAELEERVRLALWRMESALSPLIAEESGRPYFAYSPFYAPQRAYTRMFSELAPGEVLVPSTLLTTKPPLVLLHFQIEPNGRITSPQVPDGNMRDLAETGYTTRDKIEGSRARLSELTPWLDTSAIRRQLPSPTLQAEAWVRRDESLGRWPAEDGDFSAQSLERQVQPQQQRSAVEQMARIEQQVANALNIATTGPPKVSDVYGGAIQAIWQGEVLLLARRVWVSGDEYIQGCWLDWTGIQRWLREEAEDLLPNMKLEPAAPDSSATDPRQLAALPARLVPGELPVRFEDRVSLIRVSLVIAWVCVLLAATAVAILLRGTVLLSERRAAFVSAVTHEMRTPLTTARMYTDMLLQDMIPSEEKRRQYLTTLQTETHRLSRLVENVLAYARLERSRDKRRLETLTLRELTDRSEERLTARADQAGMRLLVEVDDSAAQQRVRVDSSAVEQILFNLVDNACKYATTGADRLINLGVSHRTGQAVIEIRDHGPGISKREVRRLFRPFCKSAQDAANSSPGVGLGLALCRRLARSMGGDLHLNEDYEGGASFVLTLPTS